MNIQNSAQEFATKIINFFLRSNHIDPNDIEGMKKELADLYQRCEPYLDRKFLAEISLNDSNKIYSCLWEIVNINCLINSEKIDIINHSDAGPDWKIKLKNGKKYYIEATCAHAPTNSGEIQRNRDQLEKNGSSAFNHLLIEEAKSRITNAMKQKIDKHYDDIKNKDIGYILTISWGSIGLFTNGYRFEAVKTILPIHQNGFLKLKKDKPPVTIATDIFYKKENNWISAILFSTVYPHLFFKGFEKINGINWNGCANDFVIVHNPLATYPLEEDIFSSRTQISIKNGELHTEGEDIFPFYPFLISSALSI